MKRHLWIALLASLCGCVVNVPTPPVPPERIPEGRPPEYRPGLPESYWVWHDGGGWHLRATTAGKLHRFHGFVEPAGGAITDVRPTRLEWNDRIRVMPRGIEFDFEAAGGDDGFDFHVSSGCARFFLYIDGGTHPQNVFIGAMQHHPHHIPFERCRW